MSYVGRRILVPEAEWAMQAVQRIADLQARVEEEKGITDIAIRAMERVERERDEFEAQANLRGEWEPILGAAQRQDIKWKKPMPEIDFGDQAIYAWALKAQEEMGELSAALLGGLIHKEGRGDVLEECYQLIAVLLRIARAAIDATPDDALKREKERR